MLMSLFVALLSLSNFFLGENLKDRIKYTLHAPVKYAVLGHSHPECAFNDSLIPGMRNFALSGEAYFYNYLKIKSMLAAGVRFDVAFIEYSNNSLSPDVCKWIWDDENLSRSYPRFSPFLNLSGNFTIFQMNAAGWLNAYCLSMKWRLDKLFDPEVNYLEYSGGYKWLVRNEMDSLLKARMSEYTSETVNETKNLQICNVNRFCLREMINLLRDNHVKVYLIRSPLHPFYPGFENENEYDSIYQNDFSDVELIDCAHFPLQDEEYGDFEHINHLGAKKFSLAFNDLLLQGLLDSSNKQSMVDRYFNALQ
jgi:hypothetical protein